MLEGLDDISWTDLHHMFGQADDVPRWFRDLFSPIRDVQDMAMTELSDNLYHQGTVTEATYKAIPFLFELVESNEVKKVKTRIALLLMWIADSWTGSPTNDICDKCRQLIGEKLDVLLPYLRHKEPTVRGMLVNALVRYPEKRERL